MKNFTKLNIFALIYAFVLFIQIELMINVYRLEKLLSWYSYTSGLIIAGCAFIFSTMSFLFLQSKFFNSGKIRYILTVLWIPYYIIITLLSFMIIPTIDHADEPPPVLGLVIIGIFLIYPIYIAIINLFSSKTRVLG